MTRTSLEDGDVASKVFNMRTTKTASRAEASITLRTCYRGVVLSKKADVRDFPQLSGEKYLADVILPALSRCEALLPCKLHHHESRPGARGSDRLEAPFDIETSYLTVSTALICLSQKLLCCFVGGSPRNSGKRTTQRVGFVEDGGWVSGRAQVIVHVS